MRPSVLDLSEEERGTFRAVAAFLNDRLADEGTINWALQLEPWQQIERTALIELLDSPPGRKLKEPWASAWRLIEESWTRPPPNDQFRIELISIRERIESGDRSGALIEQIVDLVAPRIKVSPIRTDPWRHRKTHSRPRKFYHLVSAKLTSGELVDLETLTLRKINDADFLRALGSELDASVTSGLDAARRLGWKGKGHLWQLGGVRIVYYSTMTRVGRQDTDPDQYHRGIAPSVKLLYEVVAQLSTINLTSASAFVNRWETSQSPIHIRLWAAAARNPKIVPSSTVSEFLINVDNQMFWNLAGYPEISELRARRFSEFEPNVQKNILNRIVRGRPRSHWPKDLDQKEVEGARIYSSVQELKRVEIGGFSLPSKIRDWLDSNASKYPSLHEMTITHGFPQSENFEWLEPRPDDRYDTIQGIERLQALELALGATRGGWDDDPASRAIDWFRKSDNSNQIISDFESIGAQADKFPRVWDRFGWTHSPQILRSNKHQDKHLQQIADRVLNILSNLSANTLKMAIDGISDWLTDWKEYVVSSERGTHVWFCLWPMAVEATNATDQDVEAEHLSITAPTNSADEDPMDLDTLNSPAGKLVGVFLAYCPKIKEEQNPFEYSHTLRAMRDEVVSADGHSNLIALHRLIEDLPYFFNADQEWAKTHLINPLFSDTARTLALWRAIARRTHSSRVLRLIGEEMIKRAVDYNLGRATRRRLVFSLIVESLHAFRENRAPAIPDRLITQMLRTLDDEVRANAASIVQEYVKELSKKVSKEEAIDGTIASASIFQSAASPFLRDVWPQERSLSTPGVSEAFASLPATSGSAFSDAVEAIERFLTHFDCWTMLDFGFYDSEQRSHVYAIVDDESKAKGFLKLLNLTIGTSERAVIPHDLSSALEHIRQIAPKLQDDTAFKRLSTAARR